MLWLTWHCCWVISRTLTLSSHIYIFDYLKYLRALPSYIVDFFLWVIRRSRPTHIPIYVVSFTCSTTGWFPHVIFENLKKIDVGNMSMSDYFCLWFYSSTFIFFCDTAFGEFSWFDSFVPPLLHFFSHFVWHWPH